MDNLIEIGDYIVFEKGKYMGQQGIVEGVTAKMLKVRIAPHSPDALKFVWNDLMTNIKLCFYP